MSNTGTITFTGLSSGIDTSEWVKALVSIKQNDIDSLSSKVSSLNTKKTSISGLESTYSKLLNAVTTLTDANLSAANMFNSTSATSSDTSKIGASSEYGITGQSYSIEVSQLATQTIAQSSSSIVDTISGNTVYSKLSGAETGSLTFYVNNAKYSVNIDSDDTLDNIATKMNDATKTESNPTGLLTISTTGGKFTIDGGTNTVSVGTTQDESNLPSTLALKSNIAKTTSSSSRAIYSFDTSSALAGTACPLGTITAGKFKIGDAEFEITSSTTMNTLISKINSTTDAGVNASFDSLTGKFTLTSTDTGAFNINVENGTSNFLQVMGLTTSQGAIATGSQTLGQNAKLTINDVEIESFSNTVTSETTGVKGLTLTLNDETETDKPVTVSVSQDTSSAFNAINSFISEFNTVLTKTDSLTGKDGTLNGEGALVSLRNRLRTYVSNAYSDNTTYKTLASIGITTGKVGTSTDANTDQLQIDKTKFLEALKSNPEEVKKLLIGDPKSDTTGIIGGLETTVEGSLDNHYGYFSTTEDSVDNQVKTLKDRIDRKTDLLTSYSEMLTSQFTAMEKALSSMQSSYSDIISSLGSQSS